MKKNNRTRIGEIGVDAGLCWIGDPCYILHKEEKDNELLQKDIGKSWLEFCKLLGDKYPITKQFGHCLGVCVSTGWGDGIYPVYAEFEEGRVARVIVDFMSDEEDEG